MHNQSTKESKGVLDTVHRWLKSSKSPIMYGELLLASPSNIGELDRKFEEVRSILSTDNVVLRRDIQLHE